jgi:hypothetical protein
VPESLARLPELGTLRLEGNALDGGLDAFASALPEAGSRLFHLDVSRNRLTGPVPKALKRLGVFAADQQFVTATDGGQVGARGAAGRGPAGSASPHCPAQSSPHCPAHPHLIRPPGDHPPAAQHLPQRDGGLLARLAAVGGALGVAGTDDWASGRGGPCWRAHGLGPAEAPHCSLTPRPPHLTPHPTPALPPFPPTRRRRPQVPQAYLACSCPVSVRLAGGDMRLACPRGVANVSDFYWQLASQSGFTCWTGRREVPLTDYLTSPNNVADPSDTQGPIFSDSGPRRAPSLSPGGAAGLAIAVLFATAGLGAAGYFFGYRRLWRERAAKAWQRYEEEGAPAGGGGVEEAVGGGGGRVEETGGGSGGGGGFWRGGGGGGGFWRAGGGGGGGGGFWSGGGAASAQLAELGAAPGGSAGTGGPAVDGFSTPPAR